MTNVNICNSKRGCCPIVNTCEKGTCVCIKEHGTKIKLTFEQVGAIYKQMSIERGEK